MTYVDDSLARSRAERAESRRKAAEAHARLDRVKRTRGFAIVYWRDNHYRVELDGRELARFPELERKNAADFANGFNLGRALRDAK